MYSELQPKSYTQVELDKKLEQQREQCAYDALDFLNNIPNNGLFIEEQFIEYVKNAKMET